MIGVLIACLCLTPLTAAVEAGSRLHGEDFGRFQPGITPTGFDVDCHVAVEHGSHFVRFLPPRKGATVYREPVKIAGASGSVEIRIGFRIPEKVPLNFRIMIEAADGQKACMSCRQNDCRIDAWGKDLKPLGFPSARWIDTLGSALVAGCWHRIVIQQRNGLLTSYLEKDGSRVALAAEKMPRTMTAFNLFSSQALDINGIDVQTVRAGQGANEPRSEKGWQSSDAMFEQGVSLPDGTAAVTTRFRSGSLGLKVALTWEDGANKIVTVRPFCSVIPPRDQKKGAPVVVSEAGIELCELKVRSHVRPNPSVCTPETQETLIRECAKAPLPLSRRCFELSWRLDGRNGAECYLDSQYLERFSHPGKLKTITFTMLPGSALGESMLDATRRPDAFLPLCLKTMDRPGKMKDARLTVTDDRLFKTVPFVRLTSVNMDLGLTARHRNLYAAYTFRSALDNIRESFLFSVPADQYTRAWVLCAVEDDPAKDPSITARLTRYVPGSSWAGRARECLADTTLQLPRGDEKATPGTSRVGTVRVGSEELPLWLVEIPLGSGDIQDIVFDDKGPKLQGEPLRSNLDFELLGRLTPLAHPFNDRRYMPLASAPSGVHVFGVTLERPPAEMEVRQNQSGNIFHNDEKPEVPVALRTRRDGNYGLNWTIRDAEGNAVGGGEKRLSLKAADGEQICRISLAQPGVGWFEIRVELKQGQRSLLSHTASFALLGPDTRQAGVGDSPFGTWSYGWHYCPDDINIVGPLLRKAGFRRAFGLSGRYTEASLAPWKLTASTLGWPAGLLESGASDEVLKKWIGDAAARYPHCTNIMVLWESAPGGYRVAPELIGRKHEPKQEFANADKNFEHSMRLAKIVRENFPHLRIMIGNSLGCSELIAELLRRKFPEAYADYLGNETVVRTGQPEKLWAGGLQTAWLMREVARKYGYHQWKVTSCCECDYRHDRILGQQRQAEWYVRDVMLSFAYRFPHINTAVAIDTGNVYNESFWGGTGLCRRYPLLYPKKSYVAMATVTRVLDRVKFLREIPTACNSVYALEFSRPDGKAVYAVWAGRGAAELELNFKQDSTIEIVDLYGRARTASTLSKRLNLTAQTAVQYLVTKESIDTIRSGRRSYPEDAPPANLQVVAAMDKADDWQLAGGKDPFLEETSRPELPYRTAGQFSLRQAKDAEKGDCLEVELHPRADLPELMSEYAVLRLKRPIAVRGMPTTLGLWVKGNSGWGEVYWEIEDANGVRRLSCGTTVHETSVFDYDGQLATINFEGWNFLRMPITQMSPVPDLSTGSVDNLWQTSNRSRPVAYPIKITGVAVALPPKALYLTEMRPIQQIIRLKDLSAYQ